MKQVLFNFIKTKNTDSFNLKPAFSRHLTLVTQMQCGNHVTLWFHAREYKFKAANNEKNKRINKSI